jgi:hypothetical protein
MQEDAKIQYKIQYIAFDVYIFKIDRIHSDRQFVSTGV